MKKAIFINILAITVLMSVPSFVSGRTRVAGSENGTGNTEKAALRVDQNSDPTLAVKKLTFVQKVSDNRVYATNIVGHISFTIQSDDKNITVPGYLRMRKDQVIRLQLCVPLVGTEIARIDFYPDSVLMIDRYHKEYVKAGYSQVPFLEKQGITFYSLQALFWNQLLLPGNKSVSESDLKKFDVNLDGTSQNLPVTYKNGKMLYQWQADRTTGRINELDIDYAGGKDAKTSLAVKYSNFQSVGVKTFPATQNYTINTNATQKAQNIKMNIVMDQVTTDSNWDVKTQVSDKYKQVTPEMVLGKIMSF
ncbi:MAG: DUF4292 domain-containing protein [Prevotella sp.]|jgi:uncharacterized lipoprotein YehR (DUF1307 family)|nr:DUF4292 domain-containing protein [Prevotella sp.]MCI1246681.1 DUF4292 domain-containing protein [Prevotella sp.]